MIVQAAAPNLAYRVIKDRVFQALIVFFSFLTFLPLLLIIFHIVQNGIAVVDWQFLTHLPRPVGEVGGGIANAVVGTLMLIITASIIAIPLGVCAGVYLAERKEGRVCYMPPVRGDSARRALHRNRHHRLCVGGDHPGRTFSALSGGIAPWPS